LKNNRYENITLALHTGNYRSEKEKEVFEYMSNNIDELEKEYYEKYGDILSQDFAKYLFNDLGYDQLRPEGLSDYSRASWSFVNYLYEKQLIDKKGEGNNAVLITGGGTGAGKTTTALRVMEEYDYTIINDTNVFYLDRSKLQIERAIENGYQPQIIFIYRDPIDAYMNGVLKRIRKGGHLVTIENHVKIAYHVKESINVLAKEYSSGLDIFIFDNEGDIESRKEVLRISIKELNTKQYYIGELENILKYETKKLYEDGKITEEIYNGANFKATG